MTYKEMTRNERSNFNFASQNSIKGERKLFLCYGGRIAMMDGNYYIRETESGYYLQSFGTLVAYISKKTGKLFRIWSGYSKNTMVHLNWFLQWIRNTTKTIPEKNHISWNQFQKHRTMKKYLEYGKRSKNIIAWNMEKVQDVL